MTLDQDKSRFKAGRSMELSLESAKWVWGDACDRSITDKQWIDNG